MEKAAVQNVERQEEQRRRQGTQPHCQPEAVTRTPRQAETARSERIHGKGLLSLRERDLPVIICIRSSPLLVKHGLDEGVDVFQMAQLAAVPPQGRSTFQAFHIVHGLGPGLGHGDKFTFLLHHLFHLAAEGVHPGL